MPTIDVDGDRLHYTENGGGDPVVFVHGSCGGAGQWKALASGLSDRYRCICLDLFGNGQSEPWPIERNWTCKEDERAINAILDLVGEPAHFIIHSGGGHFAWPTIKNRRQQVRSLTFFEPAYFHLLQQEGNPLFSEPEGMANRYRELMRAGDQNGAISSFVDVWARKQGAWESLPEAVKETMNIGADRLYHEWLTVWHEEPSVADLADLDIPALLFVGSETLDSERRVCEIIGAALPNCQMKMVEGAGHMAPFTHAAQVLPTVDKHLSVH